MTLAGQRRRRLPQVFVYGSLRRGQRHHTLLAGADFRGSHRTVAEFTMFDLGPYPGVAADGVGAIVGEVYAIPWHTLLRLDRLEGHPIDYRRRIIETPFGDCWIYIYRHRNEHQPIVAGGDWLQRRKAAL